MHPTRRRLVKMLSATGLIGAGGLAVLGTGRANAYYRGPVSDHFDGELFFNPGGPQPKGVHRVLQLYFLEKWEKWPVRVESRFADKPPAEVIGARARIAFVGHASWLIQAGGLNILVDPHWSDRASPFARIGPTRCINPGIRFEDLPRIHAVLVTHNHYDHLDLPTLAQLWARDRPRIITPLGNDTIMRQGIADIAATAVDWGDRTDLGSGIIVHIEPTQHWSARGARDRRHALWASFVIETPAGKIYAVGDSGLGDGRTFRQVAARHPKIRMALLPIGAYEPRWFMKHQHMNPDDAVEAFGLCGAEAALGHHWGTFQLTTEARDAPPAALAEALRQRGIAGERFHAVYPGEAVEI
jgi:L-ascorbate metabolism protein UlaG (beta-lactamase superfamily)